MVPTIDEAAVVDLERRALARWCKGDPGGFVEHAIPEVTYFDHLTQACVVGIDALREHSARFVGKVDVPRSEMVGVNVRVYGDVATLTFNWETYSAGGDRTSRWNATEVLVRRPDGWKYAHLHWAVIAPPA